MKPVASLLNGSTHDRIRLAVGLDRWRRDPTSSPQTKLSNPGLKLRDPCAAL
jgi:hypothetical protein